MAYFWILIDEVGDFQNEPLKHVVNLYFNANSHIGAEFDGGYTNTVVIFFRDFVRFLWANRR